ncbi:MAG: hypothetical protein IJC84_05995 [Clostridia bacterium]|nr:hypothetical protein [Clostridia bacterium]
MKKRIISLLCGAVGLVAGIFFGKWIGGFIGEIFSGDGYEVLPEERYVYFADSEEELGSEAALDGFDLAFYESRYKSFNTRTYYHMLNTAEQRIYRILEYALDEGKDYILGDARLLLGCRKSVVEITFLFSTDSPLVEQNLAVFVQKGVTVPYAAGEFFRVEIPRFGEEFLEKKEEAIEKARKIAAEAPAGSDMEAALYFYQYLTDNVAYLSYEGDERAEAHFLHDVFFQNRAHCDGFANGYSLLCALRGIPAFEKQFTPPEGADEIGHAWNTVMLDGDWYNVDCALSADTAKAEMENDILFRFAFSDELQTEIPDHAEELPPCEKDYLTPAFRLPSADDPAFYGEIDKAFRETERHYIFFSLEEDDVTKEHLQEIANRQRSGLRVLSATRRGRVYYYLLKTK